MLFARRCMTTLHLLLHSAAAGDMHARQNVQVFRASAMTLLMCLLVLGKNPNHQQMRTCCILDKTVMYVYQAVSQALKV